MEVLFYAKLIFVVGFILAKLIFDFFKKFKWRLTGVYYRLQSNKQKQPLNHEVGHLEDITLRYKADITTQPPALENFITTHAGFVDPSYILSPNVTLYSITADEAIFVETDEDIDVYNMENGGVFLSNSQYVYAKRIITLPMWAFLAISEKIGKPKLPLVFVTMTNRCGSSLLLQILDATKKCVVISEAATFNIDLVLGEKVSSDRKRIIFESVLNVLCKSSYPQSEMYVFKFGPLATCSFLKAAELFPDAKFLFTYRKGLDMIRSACYTIRMTPWVCVLKWASYLSYDVFNIVKKTLGIADYPIHHRYLSYYQISTLLWSASLNQYEQMRKSGLPIQALRYEDVIGNTEETMREVFKYLNIIKDYDHDIVVKQMQLDSQRNTPFRRDVLRSRKPMLSTNFSRSDLEDMREIWRIFNVPDFENDVLLPGTIGHTDDTD